MTEKILSEEELDALERCFEKGVDIARTPARKLVSMARRMAAAEAECAELRNVLSRAS